MPEFLSAPFSAVLPVSPAEVALRLVIALILGGIVSWIYKVTRAGGQFTASFPPTLVLLAVLIAMVTQVIGDSVARAFSLVGTLSIVRFRTVVRDTQDTAFVIFAVVVGMACGTSDPRLAVVGIAVVGTAAFLMRPRSASAQAAQSEVLMLEVRVTAHAELEPTIGPTIDAHTASRHLKNVSTAKQGAAMDASYLIQLRTGHSVDQLVRALNGLEAVISAEVNDPDAEGRDDED